MHRTIHCQHSITSRPEGNLSKGQCATLTVDLSAHLKQYIYQKTDSQRNQQTTTNIDTDTHRQAVKQTQSVIQRNRNRNRETDTQKQSLEETDKQTRRVTEKLTHMDRHRNKRLETDREADAEMQTKNTTKNKTKTDRNRQWVWQGGGRGVKSEGGKEGGIRIRNILLTYPVEKTHGSLTVQHPADGPVPQCRPNQ